MLYKEHGRKEELGNEENFDQKQRGPPIIKAKIDKALKKLSNKKAPGPDKTTADVIKWLNENTLMIIFNLTCKIYETVPYITLLCV